MDDAVYVEQINDNEYLLGVYIADVSYYVTEDSVLDKEARERGTSVYLVDRVLPMLPERLSNGICSLNAGEDRLSMACEMHIDKMGKVLSYEIFPAVINVRHRLSYNIVRAILAGDKEMCDKYEDILPMIARMDILRQILHDKRARRGAVDFDLPEQKVILDESCTRLRLCSASTVMRSRLSRSSCWRPTKQLRSTCLISTGRSSTACMIFRTRKNAGVRQAAGKLQY